MKKIKQFRFYSESAGTGLNQPVSATPADYSSGAVFRECKHILQLGVQTLPGVKFSVNGSEDEIIVGTTGVYELELNNNTEITSLKIAEESMGLISSSKFGYIIIDVVYDDRKE